MADFFLREAVPDDVPALLRLIELSVRGLQARDYSPAQLDCALGTVYGVDSQLIADGTYFVVQAADLLVAGGGWSKRRTLYGGDRCAGREDALLDPACEAAKIRAFFVHPDWARRGIGGLILEACERAAQEHGFRRCEMGATLTGVPFYRAKGYVTLEDLSVPLANGEVLPIVRMGRDLPRV